MIYLIILSLISVVSGDAGHDHDDAIFVDLGCKLKKHSVTIGEPDLACKKADDCVDLDDGNAIRKYLRKDTRLTALKITESEWASETKYFGFRGIIGDNNELSNYGISINEVSQYREVLYPIPQYMETIEVYNV